MKVTSFILLFLCANSAIGQISTGDTLIDLRSLRLTSIPDSVFEKTNALHLDLGVKEMIVYPPLAALADSANELTEIPESISKLKKLRTLNVCYNNIRSLPVSITELTELVALDLSLNKDLDILKELDKIKQLPKLKTLIIIGNKNVLSNLDFIKNSLRPDIRVIASFNDYMQKQK